MMLLSVRVNVTKRFQNDPIVPVIVKAAY